ncbi:Uncharacterised protein [Klebsiella oxytoca]|uniref:Uncharacterized protein n=1 Tax=Klebsiella oxytoca TaxID=571 RepID=A0A6N2ZM75_KLEOX|nr:Uncharacterised protein [Klebsiella oxytoca]
MRKVQPPPQYDWPVWVGVSLICPLLVLCSLYLQATISRYSGCHGRRISVRRIF